MPKDKINVVMPKDKVNTVIPRDKINAVMPKDKIPIVSAKDKISVIVHKEKSPTVMPKAKSPTITPEDKSSSINPEERSTFTLPKIETPIQEVSDIFRAQKRIREEDIANPGLRDKAIQTIIRILENNQFDKVESEKIAVNIEKNLRKKDPSMKDYYMKLFKSMMRDIKQLDFENYKKLAI